MALTRLGIGGPSAAYGAFSPATPSVGTTSGFHAVVEMELNGFLNGWIDVTQDVIGDIVGSRGLPGASPTDRVAKVGILTMTLNNSETNSAKLLGYYSPDHANRRTGFVKNCGVRFSVVIGVDTVPQFTGRLEVIKPSTGIYGDRTTSIVVVDYMNESTKKRLNNLQLQTDMLEVDAFEMVLATIPLQPRAVQVGTSVDTIPYVFDTVKDERTTPMAEYVRLANSTLALIYVKQNGTLVYEPRSQRATTFTSLLTFGPADFLLNDSPEIESDRSSIINRVTAAIHPRTVGAATDVILYESTSPFLVQPIPTGLLIRGFYTEEGLRVRRAGGLDMLPAVPTTDYLFNTQEDGLGVDVTASVTVDTIFTANSVLFTIIAPAVCYCIKLQSRGTQIIDNADMNVEAEDADSIDAFGEVALSIDMPYNADPVFGNEVVQYLLFLAQSNQKRIKKMPMLLNAMTPDRALLCAQRDISDRISVSEPMTALSGSAFFINGVAFEFDVERNYKINWTLTVSDATNYWFLNIVGFSELDFTTRLGFGLIIGHTDVDHSDSHADVAHSDVTHSDTHGDAAHADAAHADSTHTDVAHGDVAHGDTAHSDAAHSDGSTTVSFDDSHADVAHNDNHGDVAHNDVAHGDTAHGDGHGDLDTSPPHDDFNDAGSHGDSHNDSHYDITHADVTHLDGAHTDYHGDDAHGDGHVDIPHTDLHFDSPHGDVTHADVLHSDSHGDAGHGDAGHADSAHSDSHTDVLHVDVAHEDSHGDTEHGDQN